MEAQQAFFQDKQERDKKDSRKQLNLAHCEHDIKIDELEKAKRLLMEVQNELSELKWNYEKLSNEHNKLIDDFEAQIQIEEMFRNELEERNLNLKEIKAKCSELEEQGSSVILRTF